MSSSLDRLRTAAANKSGAGIKMRDLVHAAELIATVQECFNLYKWSPMPNSPIGKLKDLIDDLTGESGAGSKS